MGKAKRFSSDIVTLTKALDSRILELPIARSPYAEFWSRSTSRSTMLLREEKGDKSTLDYILSLDVIALREKSIKIVDCSEFRKNIRTNL